MWQTLHEIGTYKARYTLATKSTLLPIRSILSSVLATNRQQLEFDSLSRSTVPITGRIVANMVDFVADTVDRLCRLSTKSTVLNSTLCLSPVCTGLNKALKNSYRHNNKKKHNHI